MNLLELREEINAALDYNPDLKQYRDMTARIINRHYLQLSTQYPWLFLHKTYRMTLRADIEGDSDTTITIGDTTEAYANTKVFPQGTNQWFQTPEMMGNYLVIKESTSQTSNSKGHGGYNSEYLITGIYYSESYSGIGTTIPPATSGEGSGSYINRYNVPDVNRPGTNGHYIVVDRPIIDPSTVVVADGDNNEPSITKVTMDEYTIQFRRYWLPPDCAEVLGVIDRGFTSPVHTETSVDTDGDGVIDGGSISTSTKTAPDHGRLTFIDRRKEEMVYLDRDNSGNPVVAIEDEPMFIHPPPGPMIVEEVQPDSMTGAPNSASVMLRSAATYEYCYTFLYCGIESPPSPVTSLKYTGASGIRLRGMIDTRGVYPDFDWMNTTTGAAVPSAQPSGMYKRIYRRKVDGAVSVVHQGFQRWHHVADVSELAGASVVNALYDTGTKVVGNESLPAPGHLVEPTYLGWPGSDRTANSRWTYHDGQMHKLLILDESGPRQCLRVYRRPSNDMDIEVRYLSRPRRLVADADTPEWPPQFHHLLVYKALQDIAMQHGMTTHSQLYEKRSEELLDRMRQKHLSRPDRMYVRAGFDRSFHGGERWGIPAKVEPS
jgi:hypothetical protein